MYRRILLRYASSSSSSPLPPASSSPSKLLKHLQATIKMTGPLSVATYMRHALVHPLGGYYMNNDVFGKQGDFTTSPEISQIFGEMMALWILIQYRLKPHSQIQLIELGPGRGTLMNDILRTLSQYKDIDSAIQKVCLVEASPHLRSIQKGSLESFKKPLEFHDYFQEVPTGIPSVIIAHEFFDALPVYLFQYTKEGWREILIDYDNDGPLPFRYVLAPSETNASRSLANESHYEEYKIIDKRIEVCPESWDVARSIATRIESDGGMALIADYGQNHVITDSLRGVSKHKFIDILNEPGSCDITADVDFSLLAKAAAGHATCFGPISQAQFLQVMGISARLKMLLTSADATTRLGLIKGVERLIGTGLDGMGNIYKIQTMLPLNSVVPYAFASEDPSLLLDKEKVL